MESRDSLPSSSPSTNNRDAPSAAAEVDDGLFALAKDAAMHYQSGKFVECVEVMNQLLQKKPNDPKVIDEIAPMLILLSTRIARCFYWLGSRFSTVIDILQLIDLLVRFCSFFE